MIRKILLPAALITIPHMAQAGILEVKSFKVSGDCSEENTQGILTDEDDCNIIFGDMLVASQSKKKVKRKCHFEAAVKVPDGYQIAADSMTLDGEFSVEDHKSSRVKLSTDYRMADIGKKIKWSSKTGDDKGHFPRGETGSFSLEKSADKIVYAPCGQDVVFTGNLEISARGQGSFINLDQSIAKWDWKLRPCLDHDYPLNWESDYYAANGRKVHAHIAFKGDGGRYTLDNGISGKFSKVRYKDDVISGYWHFHGKKGWFWFELMDDQSYFSGSWGYGKKIGHKPRGHWSGAAVD